MPIGPERISDPNGASFSPAEIADTVYIYQESDFPAPSGGVIQLENKRYVIVNNIVTANTLRIPATGRCHIRSNFTDSGFNITYTGANSMFDQPAMSSALLLLENLVLTSAAKFLDVAGDANSIVIINFSTIIGVADLGNITGIGFSIESSLFAGQGQGFIFTACNTVNIVGTLFPGGQNNPGQTLLSYFGACGGLRISGNLLQTGGPNETLMSFDAAFVTSGLVGNSNAVVNVAGGTVFAPGGKDKTDPSLVFQANTGIADSAAIGDAYVDVPQTVTITTINQFELISDANTGSISTWTMRNLEQFSFDDTTGEFTYIGNETKSIQVTATATIEKVGGGSDRISIACALNGVIQAPSESETQNNQPTSVTSIASFTVAPGDVLAVYCRNKSGTSDIIIDQMLANLRQ